MEIVHHRSFPLCGPREDERTIVPVHAASRQAAPGADDWTDHASTERRSVEEAGPAGRLSSAICAGVPLIAPCC